MSLETLYVIGGVLVVGAGVAGGVTAVWINRGGGPR